ncbi:relaxase/mobilization nuclease domain-containing protein [Lacticaseibacillus paracasei]|uniref:relaxase/mobilization nuclease domain-containing protein n=2 Tax=Lacticaseibacillus paracasei TaxID=1597 RepID=UPI0031F5BF09
MATIKISRAQNGTAALNYALGQGKLKQQDRDWLLEHGVDPTLISGLTDRAVARGGENIDLAHVKEQMQTTRTLFGQRGKTEVMRVIQSFGPQDFVATNPADWQRVNDLGVELGRRIAPNHEVAVYTHLDGDGHKLHNHIIINMPNLETGKKYHHTNDWQRVTRLNDQLCQDHDLTVIQRPEQQERHTLAERKISAKGAYVWKDDLRERIDHAMQNPHTSDFKTLSAVLSDKGVTIHVRGQNVSYAFLDAENKHRQARGSKLGSSYEKGAIFDELANRSQIRETQRLSEQDHQRLINAHRATEQRERQTQSRKPATQRRESAITPTAQDLSLLASTSGRLEQKAQSMGTHYHQVRQRLRTAIKPLAAGLQRFNEAIPRLAKAVATYLQQQVSTSYVALKQKLDTELGHAPETSEQASPSATYQQLLNKLKENEAIGKQKQQTQQRHQKSLQQQQQNEGPTLGL